MLLQIRRQWVYLISAFLCTIWSVGTDATVVQTKIGKIRGLEETTSKHTKYYAFKGIPYAKAPTAELRFKNPIPMRGWEGILDGTLDGPVCPQLHIATNNVIGQEDNCLSLNIYTPDVDNLKPVIVFIHGGGFTTGSSHSLMYGPDYLMDEGVLLVTFNYRLHVLGFLSTGTKDATGNYGLFDQILALEWVKSNIASFGGDPEKITLMGEGAGAASATLLTLTQKAKGLFRNVIALGGTPLNSQYFQKNPAESARELVSRFECSYEDFGELVGCLRKADTEKLVKEVNNMFSFFSFPRWFAPSVDNVLFNSPPEQLMKDGKVEKIPILTGLARHEGAFYYPLTLNSFNDGQYDGNYVEQRIPRLLPVISEFESKLFPITKSLKKRYFTNIDLENEDEFRPRYIELLTDMLYTRYTTHYGNLLANQSIPVYYYVLDYYGSHSIMDVIGDTDMKFISHGDTLQYVFTQVLGEGVELPPDDKEFATKNFIPLLLNFAKSSNPTPSGSSFGAMWPKFNEKDQTVCLIGRTLSLEPHFRSNILKWWQNDLPKVGKTKEEL